MGCYNCGSSDGTDTRLCPRCAENRARRRADPYTEHHSSYKPESKLPQLFFGGVVTICIVSFIGYNLHKGAEFRSLPIHERFYQKCMEKTQRDAERAEKELRRQKASCSSDKFHLSGTSPEFMQVFNSYSDVPTGFKEASLAVGRKFCLETRNRCEADPTVCKCPRLRSQFHY